MSIPDPKRRMVSFRLSDAEYTIAETVSRAQGYRSLSLFARSAMLAFLPGAAGNGAERRDPTVAELRERVDRLAAELQRLSESYATLQTTHQNH